MSALGPFLIAAILVRNSLVDIGVTNLVMVSAPFRLFTHWRGSATLNGTEQYSNVVIRPAFTCDFMSIWLQ